MLEWKPMSEAPKPADWMRDPPGQLYIIACFHQSHNEEGDPEGEPELSWAQVADLSFDGFHVGTRGFEGVHGYASFRLSKGAGTHWAVVPQLKALGQDGSAS